MKRELIKEAATVEEAVSLAAEELGVAADQLTVEVLQEPQKKAFGLFGGSLAQIKATVKNDDAGEAAVAFLKDVLGKMGVTDVNVTVTREDKTCRLSLEGKDLGFIIGRRGETLDALQYLTGLVANRSDDSYCRFSLDIGNYREKRETTLTALARRNAARAAKSGRKTTLEPMNPYERRIIHTAVQTVEGATSWSIGTEPNRRVVIGPSDDNPVKTRVPSSRTRNRDHGDAAERAERRERNARSLRGEYEVKRPEREVRKFVSRSTPGNYAEDPAPSERTHSETESTATLYGRIDL